MSEYQRQKAKYLSQGNKIKKIKKSYMRPSGLG